MEQRNGTVESERKNEVNAMVHGAIERGLSVLVIGPILMADFLETS